MSDHAAGNTIIWINNKLEGGINEKMSEVK